jgi:ATP-dependent helicase Lhr and Lhr-like helicase
LNRVSIVASSQLDDRLRRYIVEKGWKGLSPIQDAAFAAIYSGQDCVIEAPTAGGKTEAVLFPLLTRIAREEGRTGVRLLYLAPLRALLNNLENRIVEYAGVCGLEAFKWHSDVSQLDKIEAFHRPPQILITTPESVEAILLRKPEWKAFFGSLTAIVIDEAHSFALGDRGGHLISLLERIEQSTASAPQRISVTATVGNPEEMLQWMAGCRAPGQRIRVEGTAPARDFLVHFFNDASDGEHTPPEERASFRAFSALVEILHGQKSIVFAPSRRKAEALAKAMAAHGDRSRARRLNVRTHHSSVSKFFREEAERLIQVASESGIDAIISTSTLELGIDIGELDWVVQIDALSSPSAFLQRVGRTGRRQGRPQRFRGLCTNLDDIPVVAAVISLGISGRTEAIRFPRKAYHLLAHQILCLSLQSHGIGRDAAWSTLRRAHCYSQISRGDFDRLLDHMIEQRFLREADEAVLVGDETEQTFLPANWRKLFAVFNSAPMYEVHEHRGQVGTLDANFVESLEPPFHFVLGGRMWLAKSVDPKSRIVKAERSQAAEAPKWTTFGGPNVPFETAQEAGRLLHSEIVPSYFDEEARNAFIILHQGARDDGWSPGRIVVHATPGGQATITTFAGDAINRTLAKLLIAEKLGKATADYRSVALQGATVRGADLRGRIVRLLETTSRDQASVKALEQRLAPYLPLWPFSPFARCLPGDLWATALAERTLDIEGFVGLCSKCEVR